MHTPSGTFKRTIKESKLRTDVHHRGLTSVPQKRIVILTMMYWKSMVLNIFFSINNVSNGSNTISRQSATKFFVIASSCTSSIVGYYSYRPSMSKRLQKVHEHTAHSQTQLMLSTMGNSRDLKWGREHHYIAFDEYYNEPIGRSFDNCEIPFVTS